MFYVFVFVNQCFNIYAISIPVLVYFSPCNLCWSFITSRYMMCKRHLFQMIIFTISNVQVI